MTGDRQQSDVTELKPRSTITPECMALALRLAGVIQHMRAESRFNIETFTNAAEAGVGGQVTIFAPCTRKPRPLPEARYVGEPLDSQTTF